MIGLAAVRRVIVRVVLVAHVVLERVAVHADVDCPVLHDELLPRSSIERPVAREEVHIPQTHHPPERLGGLLGEGLPLGVSHVGAVAHGLLVGGARQPHQERSSTESTALEPESPRVVQGREVAFAVGVAVTVERELHLGEVGLFAVGVELLGEVVALHSTQCCECPAWPGDTLILDAGNPAVIPKCITRACGQYAEHHRCKKFSHYESSSYGVNFQG